jgi:energy-coupling factor transport system substrate-specific component
MAAWGTAGVLGALLARTFGRQLGRWPLAAACAVAGLIYGGIMNVSGWLIFSGDHSADALVAYSATSAPFDATHAVGNVLFCLAFGPALVRALRRFQARLDVTWLPLERPA